MTDVIFARTAHHRRRFADAVEDLGPDRWHDPTLCAGWDVHVLSAHLLTPMLLDFKRFLLTALRHRGDTDRAVDATARRFAARSTPEVLALLREHADHRSSPPRVGPMGPYADVCIHLRDLARPLGLDLAVPDDDWRRVLDHLTGDQAVPGLLPRDRVAGLRLRATDQDWVAGSGPEVVGTAEAITMAITGRDVALTDLTGDGVPVLRQRLG